MNIPTGIYNQTLIRLAIVSCGYSFVPNRQSTSNLDKAIDVVAKNVNQDPLLIGQDIRNKYWKLSKII